MVPNTTMMAYNNDGSVGTAVQVTGVQRSLRSSSNKGHDETDASFERGDDEHHPEDEDAALEIAEEKLMDGDEEIESCDESGKPVVDTEKLERRMMTVALMKSVVETSSAKVPANFGSATNEHEKGDGGGAGEHASHSYGLRKKRARHASGRDSPEDEPSQRRARAPTRANAGAVQIPSSPSCFASTIPLPAPPMLPTNRIIPEVVRVTEGNSRQSSTANQASGPISDGLQSSQVPNPLMLATPPAGNPDVSCLQSLASVTPKATMSVSLPPVPCPLPANTTNDEQENNFGPSTSIPAAGKASESAAVSKRGRIFSIDIDPEGLEFPDMSIDVATQSVFVGSQPLPPIIGRGRAASLEAAQAHLDSKANVTFKEEEKCHSTEVSLVSAPGRGRAMSFEFFSFGINADEPLPPAPEVNVSEVQPVFMRPRGDSIIFDPDSFRDGGIHEEHALQEHALLKLRTASIDLGPDEIALMNAPGFVSAPMSIAPAVKINHPGNPSYSSKSPLLLPTNHHRSPTTTTFSHSGDKSSSTTNVKSSPHPTTITEVPSHTSFQMELLNKDGRIGIYLPEARKARIAKFHSKRKMRIWRKRIKYDCRKKLADSRPRIKGRFVKRSDMDE